MRRVIYFENIDADKTNWYQDANQIDYYIKKNTNPKNNIIEFFGTYVAHWLTQKLNAEALIVPFPHPCIDAMQFSGIAVRNHPFESIENLGPPIIFDRQSQHGGLGIASGIRACSQDPDGNAGNLGLSTTSQSFVSIDAGLSLYFLQYNEKLLAEKALERLPHTTLPNSPPILTEDRNVYQTSPIINSFFETTLGDQDAYGGYLLLQQTVGATDFEKKFYDSSIQSILEEHLQTLLCFSVHANTLIDNFNSIFEEFIDNYFSEDDKKFLTRVQTEYKIHAQRISTDFEALNQESLVSAIDTTNYPLLNRDGKKLSTFIEIVQAQFKKFTAEQVKETSPWRSHLKESHRHLHDKNPSTTLFRQVPEEYKDEEMVDDTSPQTTQV